MRNAIWKQVAFFLGRSCVLNLFTFTDQSTVVNHRNTPISSLSEKHGVPQPDSVNRKLASNLAQTRLRGTPNPANLVSGILQGNVTELSRAITLIESTNPSHFEAAATVISACLPQAGKAVRIGITGVPGVGKSTFIESFGKYLTQKGNRVAVLAVDPSSSLSHGSILGDKTRMEELVKDPAAYIRPSASGETLGGVARKTRETITLCEAAGYNVILVETVGVGQSEIAVHSMVDFFMLLKLAGAGDELQGIKRGIMEMADLIVINKADGENQKAARIAKTEFSRALHLFPPSESGWIPKVLLCSALQGDGIHEINQVIDKFTSSMTQKGWFEKRRSEQNLYWLRQTIEEQVLGHFYATPDISAQLSEIEPAVRDNSVSPFTAAAKLLKEYFKR
jgi:LAO/AO transport system kinase